MKFFRKDPNEVFTPRSPTVNDEMYVDRSDLEERLKGLVSGSKHIIIHGESGNGKTWLYKKVFSEERTPYVTVNLSNAARFGSISKAIKDKITKAQGDETRLSQVVTNHDVGIQPENIGYRYNKQKIFEVVERDPLEALMMLVRDRGGKRKGLLVFDNFETILENSALVEELGQMLILLDDEDYAKYDVKICIVGVPADIRDYVTKASSVQSLSNRLAELPEVARLTVEQANALLEKGFKKLLEISVDDQAQVFERINWSTDRIAQYLHELGLEAAQKSRLHEDVLNIDVLEEAEASWFDSSISSVRQTVDVNMNARETKAGRRNQVLYALGCVRIEDFKYSDVEQVVRAEFPESTKNVELNIIQRLGELEKSTHPVIKRVPKGDAYRIINPKVRIAIRVMLRKSGGRVERVPVIS